MKRFLISLVLVCGLIPTVSAQQSTRVAATGTSGEPVPIGATGTALNVVGDCTGSVIVNMTSATTTELVALTSGQSIYICGWSINVIGAAGPPTWKLVYGTGANCGSGTTDLTGTFTSTTTTTAVEQFVYGGGVGYVAKAPVSNALCITTTTTSPQRGILTYRKF
jgi:hypothetical protein